ncbi:MAG: porin family protein [Planctomycetota bacterium]|jgi:hypothetical protein
MLRGLAGLLLVAAWAGAETTLLPGLPPKTPPPLLHDDVEGYLQEAAFTPDRMVLAPASGGLLGWTTVRTDAWNPKLDGAFGTGVDQITAAELNLDEEEWGPVVEATLSPGRFLFRFDFFTVTYEGQSTLTRTFTFAGITFTISEDVDTRLQIDNYRLLTGFAVVKTSPFRLYLLGGLSFFHAEARLAGAVSGTGEETLDVPVPLLGVLAQAKAGRFLFEVEASGLTISLGDAEADFLDVKASAGLTLFKIVTLRAGYRYVLLDARADDFVVDATLDGFFVGLGFSF